jgi:hypothetical protein
MGPYVLRDRYVHRRRQLGVIVADASAIAEVLLARRDIGSAS